MGWGLGRGGGLPSLFPISLPPPPSPLPFLRLPRRLRILKIFLAQFWIQSEIFNGFVDLAMAADCSFIHFLDTDFGLCAFKKIFCLYFGFREEF